MEGRVQDIGLAAILAVRVNFPPTAVHQQAMPEPSGGRVGEGFGDRDLLLAGTGQGDRPPHGEAFAEPVQGSRQQVPPGYRLLPFPHDESSKGFPKRLGAVHVLVVAQHPQLAATAPNSPCPAPLQLLDQSELYRILHPSGLDQRLGKNVLGGAADGDAEYRVRYVGGHVVDANEKRVSLVPDMRRGVPLGVELRVAGRASDRGQPCPAAGVVAHPLQQEPSLPLPQSLSLQRMLGRIQDPLGGQLFPVPLLPTARHLLDEDVLVDAVRRYSSLLESLQHHLLRGALLRHFQYGVRLVRYHVVNHQEEHPPLQRDPAQSRIDGGQFFRLLAGRGPLRRLLVIPATRVVIEALLLQTGIDKERGQGQRFVLAGA